MEKTTKFISIGFIGIISFSLFFLFYFGLIPNVPSPFETPPVNKQEFEVYNITLTINYNGVNPEKKIENLNLSNYKTSVFDALLNCCSVDYIPYPNGAVYVTGIDGVKNNEALISHFWLYTVNGKSAPVGASYYYLKNDSIINWNYSLIG